MATPTTVAAATATAAMSVMLTGYSLSSADLVSLTGFRIQYPAEVGELYEIAAITAVILNDHQSLWLRVRPSRG